MHDTLSVAVLGIAMPLDMSTLPKASCVTDAEQFMAALAGVTVAAIDSTSPATMTATHLYRRLTVEWFDIGPSTSGSDDQIGKSPVSEIRGDMPFDLLSAAADNHIAVQLSGIARNACVELVQVCLALTADSTSGAGLHAPCRRLGPSAVARRRAILRLANRLWAKFTDLGWVNSKAR